MTTTASPYAPDRRRTDAPVVLAWAGSRALILLAAWLGGAALLTSQGGLDGYLALWNRWETPYYESIATLGYAPAGEFAHNAAYFPGLAIVFKAGSLVGMSAPLVGMLAALAGSLAASLALARVTEAVGGSGLLGTAAWLLSPVAVFLVAPWSEAVFAGFAFWAWRKGRQGDWVAAGALAAAAALFRVNGLFLGGALVVMFLLARPYRWRAAWALVLPFVVTIGYFTYLWRVTGDPRAWFTAQSEGWDRHFAEPLTALRNTYDLIFTFNDGVGAPHSRFVVEIIAVLALVALGVVMLVMRWWAEAAYVLATVASLATSTYYYSVPRAAVVLIPIWMLLGVWMSRSRWFRAAYFVICVPALFLVTARFSQGQWIS